VASNARIDPVPHKVFKPLELFVNVIHSYRVQIGGASLLLSYTENEHPASGIRKRCDLSQNLLLANELSFVLKISTLGDAILNEYVEIAFFDLTERFALQLHN
jgi:hypothetical protein